MERGGLFVCATREQHIFVVVKGTLAVRSHRLPDPPAEEAGFFYRPDSFNAVAGAKDDSSPDDPLGSR